MTIIFKAKVEGCELVAELEESGVYIEIEEDETGWSVPINLSKGQARDLANKILESI